MSHANKVKPSSTLEPAASLSFLAVSIPGEADHEKVISFILAFNLLHLAAQQDQKIISGWGVQHLSIVNVAAIQMVSSVAFCPATRLTWSEVIENTWR